jgi:hypothetical protein
MTTDELILRYLVIRPMSFNDLTRAVGCKRNVLTAALLRLAGENRIWRDEGNGRGVLWAIDADPMHKQLCRRDFSIERESVGNGHVIVRFGDHWRAGHGQLPPASPGRANALGNIYA